MRKFDVSCSRDNKDKRDFVLLQRRSKEHRLSLNERRNQHKKSRQIEEIKSFEDFNPLEGNDGELYIGAGIH
jgi:hypothetical protein